MIYYLSLLYSYTIGDLEKKFKECAKMCFLSKELVAYDEKSIPLSQFNFQNLDFSSGEDVYFKLVEMYDKTYYFKYIIEDFRSFIKSCYYFDQNNVGVVLKRFNMILIPFEAFEEYEQNILLLIFKRLTQIPIKGNLYSESTKELVLESLRDLVLRKMKNIENSKLIFDSSVEEISFRNSSSKAKFTLTSADNNILTKLKSTVDFFKNTKNILEGISKKLGPGLPFNECDKLFTEYADLMSEIEDNYPKIEYRTNKYLRMLEFEIEIVHDEYVELLTKINAMSVKIKQKIHFWIETLPESYFAEFSENLKIEVKKIDKKSDKIMNNLAILEAELQKISLDISKFSILQKIKYLIANRCEETREKLDSLEEDLLSLKSKLESLIEGYHKFICDNERIKKLHGIFLKNKYVLKCKPKITELISLDLIVLNGDELEVKDKMETEIELEKYKSELVKNMTIMKKMRLLCILITISVFLIFGGMFYLFIYMF